MPATPEPCLVASAPRPVAQPGSRPSACSAVGAVTAAAAAAAAVGRLYSYFFFFVM